jgi:hypothetical protein
MEEYEVIKMHFLGRRAKSISVAAISLFVVAGCGGGHDDDSANTNPDFGPNVVVMNPSMSVSDINAKLQALATSSTGFDENRTAVLFKPGTYGSASGQNDPKSATGQVDSSVGFMMTVQGLGASPDDVVINGNLRVGAAGQNALATFWRALSNLKIVPIEADESALTMRWNTSQASPLRRVHIAGNLDLTGGLAFGNFIGNSKIDGEVISGLEWTSDVDSVPGQAQYYARDSAIGNWSGHTANLVFSGVVGAPAAQFSPGATTTLATTPVSRDVPFLFINGNRYEVFVPNARLNASGTNWGTAGADGVAHPITDFYLAKPSDTASTINAQLSGGKSIILTPGVYKLDQPIHVVKANTVVMGLGMATVTPTAGTAAIAVDDVPGVVLSSFLVDANTQNSATLVQVGTPGAHLGDASNPTTLSDIFVRVGGAYAGRATTSFEINQNNVLVDHTWLWRADHGNTGTSGWDVNLADSGMVVNGNDVTVLGLFVEHYQKAQVVWNGSGGSTIFMECEAPYDVPNQASWMNGSQNGYPCYSVASSVTTHTGTGLTSWAFFQAPAPNVIYAANAVSAPSSPNVRFINTSAGVIYGQGGFEHIVSTEGGPVVAGGTPPFVAGITAFGQLTSYP